MLRIDLIVVQELAEVGVGLHGLFAPFELLHFTGQNHAVHIAQRRHAHAVPDWRDTAWWKLLDEKALVWWRWPKHTKGLFKPVYGGYQQTMGKGVSSSVTLWFVPPKL